MSMNIGRMDRLIEIQYPERTQNEFGEAVDTWTRFARVWAQAVPLRTTERFASAAQRESKVYTFRIRYMRGIGPEMRIVHDSQNYRIIGIAELNRREGIELTAEYFQESGKDD